MKSEKPATGIMKKADHGDAVWYEVECECGSKNHYHSIWIEADSETKQISVDITTEVSTDFWNTTVDQNPRVDNEIVYWIWSWSAYILNETVRRSRLIWNILFRGYVKSESTVILSRQQALNYADTLCKAIQKVEKESDKD